VLFRPQKGKREQVKKVALADQPQTPRKSGARSTGKTLVQPAKFQPGKKVV
jgi:hypothetical protein